MSFGDDTLDPLNEVEALVAARMEQLEKIVKAVNLAWGSLYGGDPTDDLRTILKRVVAIADDVKCTHEAFSGCNQAMIKMDASMRSLQDALTECMQLCVRQENELRKLRASQT